MKTEIFQKSSLFQQPILHTAWKVSQYRVFFRPYFPVFGLNTEIYKSSYSVRIQEITDEENLRIGTLFTQCQSPLCVCISLLYVSYAISPFFLTLYNNYCRSTKINDSWTGLIGYICVFICVYFRTFVDEGFLGNVTFPFLVALFSTCCTFVELSASLPNSSGRCSYHPTTSWPLG